MHSSLFHCCLTLRFRALVFVSLLNIFGYYPNWYNSLWKHSLVYRALNPLRTYQYLIKRAWFNLSTFVYSSKANLPFSSMSDYMSHSPSLLLKHLTICRILFVSSHCCLTMRLRTLVFVSLLFHNEYPHARLCFKVVSQWDSVHSSLFHCCLTMSYLTLVFVSKLFNIEIPHTRLCFNVVWHWILSHFTATHCDNTI